MIAIVLLFSAAPLHAQVLLGEWVDDTQQRIEAHRTTPVRIIVLDAQGRAAQGAKVRIEQQRHDFQLGFTLREPGWPEAMDATAPVWHSFNAVSLDRLSHWADLAPQADGPLRIEPLDRLVSEANRRGLAVRWGGLVSADLGRGPRWLGELEGAPLREAVERYVDALLPTFADRVVQFDVYTHSLSHDLLERRVGRAMVRQLFDRVQARAPRAVAAMRFEDSLEGARLDEMFAAIVAARQDFVPVDLIAIEQRFGGMVLHPPLDRALSRLGDLSQPTVLVGLEVGGASATAAAVNLETVLRTAFAHPHIQGIWFGPVAADQVGEPTAALLDERGNPTASGEVLDGLFRELWWTRHEQQADEVGNVRTRVFAGVHEVSATLADGTRLRTLVHVPRSDEPRIIVLEPLR